MASAEEFATLVKHVHDQDAIINLLRHNVDEAGRRIQQLEAEKKKNPYGHIHFGKESVSTGRLRKVSKRGKLRWLTI